LSLVVFCGLLLLALGALGGADPFEKITISAPGISASYIGYGARLTNLLVPDKNGAMQDVVLGYDDGKQYLTDTETNHTCKSPCGGVR
jgi:aldose 1-epimerase